MVSPRIFVTLYFAEQPGRAKEHKTALALTLRAIYYVNLFYITLYINICNLDTGSTDWKRFHISLLYYRYLCCGRKLNSSCTKCVVRYEIRGLLNIMAGRAILDRLRISRHRGPSDDRLPIVLPVCNDGENNAAGDGPAVVVAETVAGTPTTSEYDWYPSVLIFWLGLVQLVMGCTATMAQIGEIFVENANRSKYVGAWAGMPVSINTMNNPILYKNYL